MTIALEHNLNTLINTQNMIIQSSLAKLWKSGRRGTSARAGHNPGHGQTLQAVIGNSGFVPKNTGFCWQHRGLARFELLYTVCSLDHLAKRLF